MFYPSDYVQHVQLKRNDYERLEEKKYLNLKVQYVEIISDLKHN